VCGICGIATVGAPPDPSTVARMSRALVHRGPDSDGLFGDESAAMAARRLSIIDLEGGDQPVQNEDGSVHLVQNGEIYNYRELRAELQRAGHTFSTRSDTEVLVHLYEERGPEFVERLRGMFALALWDARRKRLLLARDRFGIKPLYYEEDDRRIAFASELGSLIEAPVSTEVDLDALESFLAFNSVPAPMSILKSVRKLPAGHLLLWERGRRELREYAVPRPTSAASIRRDGSRELAAELLERLRDSVRAHLVADVRVGVLLSGGVDSSALTAIAAEAAGPGLSTFSLGFEEASFDELKKARLVAKRYGTDHHEIVLGGDVVDQVPEVIAAFDEPLGDSSALPTYLVARLAADHVKVVLSGEGGDELFGGYYTYVADLLAPRVSALASAARPLVERLPASTRKVSFDYRAKRFVRGASLPPLERHHAWKEIFAPDAREELLQRTSGSGFDPLDVYRRCWAETEGADPLARLQDVDRRVYLVDDLLVKVDRATMAHSLEARVPFLDQEVATLAGALPASHQVRGMAKKRLLRRAVRPLLPRSIVDGRKQGFSIPAAAWLRGELRELAREVLAPDRTRRQGYFHPQAVSAVLDRHLSGREDLSRQLWGLLSFSLWLDRVRRAS
jgi:asparagine synthase (glutamine-hydrolysing)